MMSPLIWVPLSSGTTHQHCLEEFGGLSVQKIQGEDLIVTKAFLLR